MSRAVHGFEGEGLLLYFEGEHVLAVVLPVPGSLPQLTVVDVGCHHLLETPLPVLALPETEQGFPHKEDYNKAAPQAIIMLCTHRSYKQLKTISVNTWDSLINSAYPLKHT